MAGDSKSITLQLYRDFKNFDNNLSFSSSALTDNKPNKSGDFEIVLDLSSKKGDFWSPSQQTQTKGNNEYLTGKEFWSMHERPGFSSPFSMYFPQPDEQAQSNFFTQASQSLETGIDENSNIYQSIEGLNLVPGQCFTQEQFEAIQGYFNEQEQFVPQREEAAQKYRQEHNVQTNFNISNYDANLAQNIVNAAKNSSAAPGRCYEGVSTAIAEIEQARNVTLGENYTASAFEFNKFFEDNPGELEKWGLQRIDLRQNKEMSSPYQIPDGSICVWDPGSGGTSAAHGHIAVASQGNQYYGLGPDGFWSMPDYVFVPIQK